MSLRHVLFSITGALLCFALALPGRAHADRYELAIGSAARVMPSNSVDALTEDEMAVFSMTGAVAIDRIHVPFFSRFAIEGGFDAGWLSGQSFQTLETSTSLLHWSLGARLSRELGRRMVVHGRAALGLAHVAVTIDDMFMDGPTLGDSGVTGTGYLGAAADFFMVQPGGRRALPFSFGLRFEVGYLAMLPKQLTARPDGSDHEEGAILIPETSASLGELDMSALNVRFGLVGRF